MSITYTPTTNFGSKDGLPANDPAKVIKGAEFTTEFTAIQSAFATAAPAASPTFTGTATFDDVSITNGLTVDTDTLVVDDTNNNVGIGTASPTKLLTILDTNPAFQLATAASGNTTLTYTDSTQTADLTVNASVGQLTFGTNSTERLRITSSGNVGVGTASPDNLLTIGGTTQPRLLISANGDAGASQLNFGDASDSDVGRLRYDHTDNSMAFFTSASEAMRIDSSGRVGIGLTSPARTLHVSDAMRLEPTSTPSSPSAGDLYFDSTTNKLRCYDGTTWQDCF